MAPTGKKGSGASKPTDEQLGIAGQHNPFAASKKSGPPQRKQNIVRSGNAGNSKPSPLPSASKSSATPDPTAPPPPLFPVGYKTPLSLLSERCQKNGWERPSVEPKRLPATEDGKELWTASVAIRRKHPKTGELESVYFRPPPAPSPIAVEKPSSIEAKHYASLFAMYRFSHNLRLNLQLPPQTRPYWSALEDYRKEAPKNKEWWFSLTPFETAASAPQNPPAPPPSSSSIINSRAPTPSTSAPPTSTSSDKYWSSAPEVRMPTSLRDLVETTIRSLMPSFDPTPSNSDDYETAPPTPEEASTIQELTNIGFRRGHVLGAINYLQSARNSPNAPSSAAVNALLGLPLRVAVLEYLHLHTPESDLPPSLRSSKPSDSNARIATNKDSTALGLSWKAQELSKKSGFPIELCERVMAMDKVKGEEGVALDVLAVRLVGGDEGKVMSEVDVTEGVDEGMLKEGRENEVLLLEGMLGEKRVRRLAKDGGVEVALSRLRDRDNLTLTILYHAYSHYPSPSQMPSFYLTSSTLPSYIVLHLTALVRNKFAQDETWQELIMDGMSVAGEMVEYLERTWLAVVESPPDARVVTKLLMGGGKSALPTSSPSGSGTNTPSKQQKRVAKPIPLRRSAAVDQKLAEHLRINALKKEYKEMEGIRAKLPAWEMRERIVELIENNRVVIVSGETGSGKTTQVPSFILDHLIATSRASLTSIIVTQPRRVSAIGVATRVAAERLEDIRDPNSRFLVGYAIRGERLAGRETKMLFCTTGVVLSRLSRGGDRDLEGVSHVFVDEVHERSVDSDFLLLELRDILKRNKNIKVILMSATINQKQFSDYFGGAPSIEIPGFTHPVIDHYLEEILPNLSPSYSPSHALKPSRKATQAQLNSMRSAFVARGVEQERTLMALETLTRAEKIDYGLIGEVVKYCLRRSREKGDDHGGILVFCPGVMEIKMAVDAIRSASGGESIEVFPLHANLSSQEQASVFRPVKHGHRKVVVATNVAETSITIDGIVYVIDCGRVKENTFDVETGIVKLVETWTSKAASRQRRGRAGRTRPGECFKLFSHYTEDTVMSPHPTPEIVRIPLEMLCLQIKAMREDEDVKIFLSKALDPPDVRAVDSAWDTLRRLGAIGEDGGTNARLTPLGAHLSMIPVDLRLGKMLILASIFRCLDPVLTIVALLSSKPFFLNPMEKRDEAKKARSMFYFGHSDLLSDAKAFDACLAAKNQSNSDLRVFAEDNFVSLSAFRDILTLRNEYLTALSDIDFVPFRASPTAPSLNENAGNENLLKAIIYAGTARLVKVKLPPAVFDKGISGAIERDRESREVKYYERDGRVFLHPGSLLFSETRFSTPYMSYFNKHVTTKPFLRDATEVPLYAVLLFGPKVRIDHQRGLRIGADDWTIMRAWPRIGVLVNSLRQLFDADLEANLENPSLFRDSASPVVGAMLACLERDGGLS